MTRFAFLKAVLKRIAPAFLCLILAVYTYCQILGTSSAGIVTTTVKPITDTQKIAGEAYLFRNEKVLTSSLPGVVQSLVPDGQKVSCGTEVAKVWTDFAESEIPEVQQKLEQLDAEIAILLDSKIPAGSSYSNIASYRKDANTHFMELKKNIAKGDFVTAGTIADRLRVDLNRLDALLHSDHSPETILEDLRIEKTALLHGNCETLATTDSSAYYFAPAFVDGYEDRFRAERLDEITAETLREWKNSPAEVPENVAGKLIYGYEWYLAVVVDSNNQKLFYEEDTDKVLSNESFTMTFPESRNASFSMRLQSVKEGVAVFACNEDPSDFSYLRVQKVEITVGETYGLYIPESALAKDADGQIGVYVFESNKARFCPLTVLYEGDGYVIAAEGENLALNDLVIVSATDLYDGRTY